MNVLWVVVCFKFIHGLAVIRSTRAIDIYRKYALGPIIPRLLHVASDPDQLTRFLKQTKLPFDKMYNGSCGKYIDRERLDELMGWVKENKPIKSYILPPECISSLYLYLDEDDWDILDPTYPFTEMMNDMLPMWTDITLVAALKEVANSKNKIVESCAWLCNPSSSKLILQISMMGWTGRSDAWSIFHHSCFTSYDRIDLVMKNDRIKRVISWLSKEVPLQGVYGNLYSEEHLMRWSVHLLLIFRGLAHLFDLSGIPAAKPLFDYLKELAKHSRQSNPLLSELITGGIAFFLSDFKSNIDESLPDFDKVIRVVMRGLTGPLAEQARWFLATTELYYRSYKNFFDNPLVQEDMIKSFEKAPTIVQKHWTSLSLLVPAKLDFLDLHICWEVEGNKSLQRYLLSRIDSKAKNHLVNLAFTCIPEEALIKEARWRFTYFPGYKKYLRRLYGVKRPTLSLTSFLSEYSRKNEDLFIQYKDEKDLESLPEQFMFVLAVADLFEIATGFQISSGLTYDLYSTSKSWLLLDDF